MAKRVRPKIYNRHQVNIVLDPEARKHLSEANLGWDAVELRHRSLQIVDWVSENPTEVNLRFCGKAEMIQANSYFRGKDYATDVLSFPSASQNVTSQMMCLGDILICVPVCYLQAKRRRQSLSQELDRMLIHGIIHLKGFDHERSDAAWKVMSALERVVRRQVTLALGPPNFVRERGNS